jgi:hypothetical protein
LRSSYLLPYSFTFFNISGFEPLPYQAQHTLIPYSFFHKIQQYLVVQVIAVVFFMVFLSVNALRYHLHKLRQGDSVPLCSPAS